VELYLYSPNTPSWRGVQLKKQQMDIFTLLYGCGTWSVTLREEYRLRAFEDSGEEDIWT
jgi:hypothetical protein